MQLFCNDSTVSNNTETSFQKTRETLRDRWRKTRNVRHEDIHQFPNPRHTKVIGQLETPVISPVNKAVVWSNPQDKIQFSSRAAQLLLSPSTRIPNTKTPASSIAALNSIDPRKSNDTKKPNRLSKRKCL